MPEGVERLVQQHNANHVCAPRIAWIGEPHVAVGTRDDGRWKILARQHDARQKLTCCRVEASDTVGVRLGRPEIAIRTESKIVGIAGCCWNGKLSRSSINHDADYVARAPSEPNIVIWTHDDGPWVIVRIEDNRGQELQRPRIGAGDPAVRRFCDPYVSIWTGDDCPRITSRGESEASDYARGCYTAKARVVKFSEPEGCRPGPPRCRVGTGFVPFVVKLVSIP